MSPPAVLAPPPPPPALVLPPVDVPSLPATFLPPPPALVVDTFGNQASLCAGGLGFASASSWRWCLSWLRSHTRAPAAPAGCPAAPRAHPAAQEGGGRLRHHPGLRAGRPAGLAPPRLARQALRAGAPPPQGLPMRHQPSPGLCAFLPLRVCCPAAASSLVAGMQGSLHVRLSPPLPRLCASLVPVPGDSSHRRTLRLQQPLLPAGAAEPRGGQGDGAAAHDVRSDGGHRAAWQRSERAQERRGFNRSCAALVPSPYFHTATPHYFRTSHPAATYLNAHQLSLFCKERH